jgi:hypothetical protein
MKNRKGRSTGGTNEASADLGKKNMRYTYQSNVNDDAEERKAGGRTKKNCGKPDGDKAMANAGRKPRKAGGRAASDANPFTSAREGTPAKGRKLSMEMDGGPGEA